MLLEAFHFDKLNALHAERYLVPENHFPIVISFKKFPSDCRVYMYTFLLYLCGLVTVNLPYHITLCKDFVSFIVLIEKAVYIGLLSVEHFFIKFDFVIVFVLLFSLIVSVLCFVSSFSGGGGG